MVSRQHIITHKRQSIGVSNEWWHNKQYSYVKTLLPLPITIYYTKHLHRCNISKMNSLYLVAYNKYTFAAFKICSKVFENPLIPRIKFLNWIETMADLRIIVLLGYSLKRCLQKKKEECSLVFGI